MGEEIELRLMPKSSTSSSGRSTNMPNGLSQRPSEVFLIQRPTMNEGMQAAMWARYSSVVSVYPIRVPVPRLVLFHESIGSTIITAAVFDLVCFFVQFSCDPSELAVSFAQIREERWARHLTIEYPTSTLPIGSSSLGWAGAIFSDRFLASRDPT